MANPWADEKYRLKDKKKTSGNPWAAEQYRVQREPDKSLMQRWDDGCCDLEESIRSPILKLLEDCVLQLLD